MLRIERNLAINSLLAGVLLTLTVAAADGFGLLDGLERWLYDERVARCQYFMPAPTDRVVHLDIDDMALTSIERWPWKRDKLALILDEIRLARPKAVALDILLAEPQEPEWVRRADGTFIQVDHDALLSESIRKLGCVLVPASFPFSSDPGTSVTRAVRDLLMAEPSLTEDEIAARLTKAGVRPQEGGSLEAEVKDAFLPARRDAIYARIREELGDNPSAAPEDVIRRRVLKSDDRTLVTGATRAFKDQYARAVATLELRRFARPTPPGAPPLFRTNLSLTPITPLIRSAAASGNVDHPTFEDGRVRSVPLAVEYERRVYPQLGLALACQLLGTDLGKIKFAPAHITIPRPGMADLNVPVRTLRPQELDNIERPIPMTADLPWFGGADWKSMYDLGKPGSTKQHVPILTIWSACQTGKRIDTNLAQADAAVLAIYAAMEDAQKIRDIESKPLPAADIDARLARVRATLDELGDFADAAAQTPAAQRSEQEKVLVTSATALRNALEQVPRLKTQLDTQRLALRQSLGDRAVIIGWIATASIADFVPTSLHAKCPGPVLHGVILNAVMTGEVWRTLPWWLTLLTTLLVGGLMTIAVSALSPGKALVAALLLAAGYLLLNGIVLFDYGNLVLGAAAPLTAVATVWSGGTLTRLVLEQHQRALIRRRFRSYVDPRLVDFVERHPERASFEGENREMTVVFLDLENFTKLTEASGEDTIKILNELWNLMVPVVRRHGAFLNKFLGDGIMFFYGAPEQNPLHARDAVATILELKQVMADYNAGLVALGLPKLGVRFGLTSGEMLVGDAGSSDASDYTVLGDNVNLAARLESANKATGTRNLMTDRTVELAGEGFLFRPVGKIRVVGKKVPVMTYEVLARTDEATDDERRLAELSKTVVDAYESGRFGDCADAIHRLESAFGDGRLTQLYREQCDQQSAEPEPAETFDGTITLTAK